MSCSAFSTFQHGMALSFTHSLRQRWSLTPWAYDTPVRAVVLDADGRPQLADLSEPDGARSTCSRAGSAAPTSRSSDAAPAGTVLGHEVVARARTDGVSRSSITGRAASARAAAPATSRRASSSASRRSSRAASRSASTAGGVELPDSLDDARGTMVEPLACVLRGAERVPRGRVLVVGNGFVGRLFGAVLERRGDDVFAVDSRPAPRRARPGRAGRRGHRLRARRRRDALEAVEPGGTVLVFADAGDLPADVVYRRELTVVGSRSATPATMRAAVALCPSSTCPSRRCCRSSASPRARAVRRSGGAQGRLRP